MTSTHTGTTSSRTVSDKLRAQLPYAALAAAVAVVCSSLMGDAPEVKGADPITPGSNKGFAALKQKLQQAYQNISGRNAVFPPQINKETLNKDDSTSKPFIISGINAEHGLGSSFREGLMNILTPVHVGYETTTPETRKVKISLGSAYQKRWERGVPSSQKLEDDLRKLVRTELYKEIGVGRHSVFGLPMASSSAEVISKNWPDGLANSRFHLVSGESVGSASSEASAPQNLLQLDPRNKALAQKRAEVGRAIAISEMQRAGLPADPQAIVLLSKVLTPSQAELETLTSLSKGYQGKDSLEKIHNLVIAYNGDQITDRTVLDSLDTIFAKKRSIELSFVMNGEKRDVHAVPIPLTALVFFGLPFLRRKRKESGESVKQNNEKTPSDEPVKDTKNPPANHMDFVPQSFKDQKFDPSTITLDERKKALIIDIQGNWKKDFELADGSTVSYVELAQRMELIYDDFDSHEDRTKWLAYRIINIWQGHDNAVRQRNGEAPENHFERPEQVRWAMIHAQELLSIIKYKEEGGHVSDLDGSLKKRVDELKLYLNPDQKLD